MILYMYIAQGQGQTTPRGQIFDVNRNSSAPGSGRQHIGNKILIKRKAFSLCPYVASFKMISSKSDLIHIFNDFIHVYSPGARTYNPLGTNI